MLVNLIHHQMRANGSSALEKNSILFESSFRSDNPVWLVSDFFFYMNILNAKEVVKKTGLSRTTIWRLERQGEFPLRVSLSARRVGWNEEEITKWLESRSTVENKKKAK